MKTALLVSCVAMLPAQSDSGRALWVWSNSASPLASPAALSEFFTFVDQQNRMRHARTTNSSSSSSSSSPTAIALALIEAEGLGRPNSSTADALSSVLRTAESQRLRVAPLFGWNAHNSVAFPSTDRILGWIDASSALSAAHPSLTGVSFDIEPGVAVPGSYQAYADLLMAVRAKIDSEPSESRLQLSIAGSWGYELVNVSCGKTGTNVSMLDCAVSLVDVYILMNYRNNANGCFCRPPPQRNPAWLKCPEDGSPIAANCTGHASGDGMIGKATSAAMAVKRSRGGGCRLSLGVETTCFPASDASDRRYQYKLSFCNTSLDYMNEQISLTEAGLAKAGLWDGVADEATAWAVEDYSALRALECKSITH